MKLVGMIGLILAVATTVEFSSADDTKCMVCKDACYAVGQVVKKADSETISQLEMALGFLDQILPTEDKKFVAFLQDVLEAKPEEACEAIELCELPSVDGLEFSVDTCQLCEYAMEAGISVAEKYLNLDLNIEKVKELVEQKMGSFCKRLGDERTEQCQALINIIAINLDKLTVDELRNLAPVACEVGHFCDHEVTSPQECNVCTAVLNEAVKELEAEIDAHDTDIGDALKKLCEKLPQGFQATCEVVLPALLQQGEHALGVLPDYICNAIHACP